MNLFNDSGKLSTEDMFEEGGEVIAMDFVAVIDESNAASVVSQKWVPKVDSDEETPDIA